MWIWDQSAGKLYRQFDPEHTEFVSAGYSGKGRGKNNPSLQGVQGVGPIPRGDYNIAAVYNSNRVGPYALRLEPLDGGKPDTVDELDRGAFRVHGDSIKAPGTASNGCIILPRAIRVKIWKSGDRLLRVIE